MLQKPFTEEEAFAALQTGSEKGLAFLFDRYYEPLTFYSASITKNAEVAREMVSEAFVKLWHKRATIEEWQKVKPLLYRVVCNASIDYLREQKTQVKYLMHSRRATASSERAILDKLVETETYHQLYRLLEILPPRSRQIFRMFYFQKKAIKEIAAELGISVNTVKTQKLRALQLLREHQSSLYIFIVYCLFFV